MTTKLPTALEQLLIKQVQVGGVQQPSRGSLNLIGSDFVVADNPDNDSTDITINVAGAVIGTAPVGVNTLIGETPQDVVNISAGATVNIWTLSGSIAFKQRVLVTIVFAYADQATGSHIGMNVRQIYVVNNAGTITTGAGTSDWDITPSAVPVDSALAGTQCKISISSNTLVASVQAPGGVALVASVAQVSFSSIRFPGTGPTPTTLARTVGSGPGSGGTVTRCTFDVLASTIVSITVNGTSATFVSVAGQPNELDVTTGVFTGVPGTGPIIATNINGPGTDTTAGFNYTTTGATFASLWGSLLRAQWENTDIQHSGGTCTSLTDETANANNLTASGSPTYNASSGTISPAGPTAGMSGSSQFFANSAFTMGGGATGMLVVVVSKQTANGAWVASFNQLYINVLTFGDHTPGHWSITNANSGAVATETGASTINTLSMAWAWVDFTSGAAKGVDVATGTNAPQSASATNSSSEGTTGTFSLGGTSGLAFMTGELVAGHVVALPAPPTPTEMAIVKAIYHQDYGV